MGTATRSPPLCASAPTVHCQSWPRPPFSACSPRAARLRPAVPPSPSGWPARAPSRAIRAASRASPFFLQRALPAHTHGPPGGDAHGHAGAGAAARGLGRRLQRGRHHLHRRDERGSGGHRALLRPTPPGPPPAPPGSANLTVIASAGGSVSGAGIACPTDCVEPLALGSSSTLSAAPAAGYRFEGWQGACTGTGGRVATVGGPTRSGAEFGPLRRRLPSFGRPRRRGRLWRA